MFNFYAQNFEDVILDRIFHHQNSGTYIDVGAWDPEEYSVTLHFYQNGWRGINIEPIHTLHQKLTKYRPEDVNLNIALGAQTETRVFFECDDTALSTFDLENAARLRLNGHSVTEYEIEVRTLADICRQYCQGRIIDFLKVDVEGWEDQVIRSADWQTFRPRVLVIEATRPESCEPSWQDWEGDILAAGYLFCYFDGLSRFYIRKEESHLLTHFQIPPGLFDGFSPPDLFRFARDRDADINARARALAECGAMQTALEAEVAHRRGVEEELAHVREELTHVREELTRTGAELAHARSDIALLRARFNRTIDERFRRVVRRIARMARLRD